MACPTRLLSVAPLTASLNVWPAMFGLTARIREYWLSTEGSVPVDQFEVTHSPNDGQASNPRLIESPSAAIELGTGTVVGRRVVVDDRARSRGRG